MRLFWLLLLLAACAPIATTPADLTPLLHNPQGEVDISENVLLEWSWSRPLAAGETFDLLVWLPGEEPRTLVLHDTTTYDLTDWLRVNSVQEFFWTVRVVDRRGEPLSPTAPYGRVQVQGLPLPTETPVQATIDHLIAFIPEGFRAELYARTALNTISVIVFGPDEHLYALSVDGRIWRLRDDDGDGFAEAHDVIFADSESVVQHAVGMAFGPDGLIYLSHQGTISTLDTEGTLTPIITDLPALQYPLHSNNGIAFGPDGKLYIAVGSTTDHGPIRAEWEASILRANADGSDLEVFATGLRNAYDLAFSPGGDLFTADNSPDRLNPTLRYLPPEELNHIREGRDYGFPRVFGRSYLPGETSEPPITEFYTSVASSGLVYYAAEHFPPAYRDGVFVAQFGTGAHPPIDRRQANGFAVVFVPLQPTDDGTFTGDFEPFVQFNTLNDREAAITRPVDVTVGPDGALYISEAERGEIYRITYAP